jgi:hypothetical protein
MMLDGMKLEDLREQIGLPIHPLDTRSFASMLLGTCQYRLR